MAWISNRSRPRPRSTNRGYSSFSGHLLIIISTNLWYDRTPRSWEADWECHTTNMMPCINRNQCPDSLRIFYLKSSHFSPETSFSINFPTIAILLHNVNFSPTIVLSGALQCASGSGLRTNANGRRFRCTNN